MARDVCTQDDGMFSRTHVRVACVRQMHCTVYCICQVRIFNFGCVLVLLWLRTCMCSPHEFVRPTTTTLAGPNIGPGGAKYLAKALEVNSSLQTLDLISECCCYMVWGWWFGRLRAGRARVYGCEGEEGNYAKSRSTRALIEEEGPVMVRVNSSTMWC